MQPKLSVCLITYNHARFIKQALEGALIQQCNFDFEIVVGNDCSTDGTTEIVQEYASLYPGKVRINHYEKNVGMTENWRRSINACRGEYIALLEGDDYWNDPLKLQKQVDILGNDPHLSFTCHDAETIFEEGVPAIDYLSHPGISRQYSLAEILDWRGRFFIPTASVVFRRKMLPAFPTWVNRKLKCIDIVVEYMLAANGPCLYINEKMGKYRIHGGGVSQINWLGREHVFEFDIIYILRLFNIYSGYKFKTPLDNRIEWLYSELLKKNDLNSKAYRRALFSLVRINPWRYMDLFKGWIIHKYIPASLYKLYKKKL